MRKGWLLLISIIICEAAGLIGSVFTSSAIPTWYAALAKPGFNPPNWVFAPVWAILFLLMGISLYLVWVKGTNAKRAKPALIIFFAQLVLNILWTILFFGLQLPLAAFIEIVILWLFILWAIIRFYQLSKPAAYLLIPYILWVSFAATLNFSIFVLNSM